MKRSTLKKKKKRSQREILKDRAWDTFSIYIRKRDKATCFTCDKRIWDEEKGEFTIVGFNAGHFKHGVLDFDEKNIHCQCIRCNHHLSGNLDVYAERFIKKYGLKEFNALIKRASMAQKGEIKTEEEYLELIALYKNKLQEYAR